MNRLAAALLALATLAGPLSAAPPRRGAGRAGSFDFYVLALSWSPTYCALTGERRNDRQCDKPAATRASWSTLWPQYDRGFPSECGAFSPQPEPPGDAGGRGRLPERGAGPARMAPARHLLGPGSRRLFPRDAQGPRGGDDSRPPVGSQGRSGAAPIDIARQFVAANPGLAPGHDVGHLKAGQLEEVRICFTKDLRGFTACPEVARQNCRARRGDGGGPGR